MNTKKWFEISTYSLAGKTVAISGATGSIGCELCKILAKLGARLVMLDRNMDKSNALRKKLQAEFKNLSVTHILLNLEDMESVKNATEQLLHIHIDILILNAGAYNIPRRKCSTGWDNIFQINFVSPYYIASKLLPLLQARNGKLVVTGSLAHMISRLNKNNIDYSFCKDTLLSAEKVYGNAKRFLMFSLIKLCKGSDVLSIAHPGISFTNLMTSYPKPLLFFIKPAMKLIFMKPEKACLSMIYGIFTSCKENQWIGPKYFGIWGLPKKKKLHTYNDVEALEILNFIKEVLSL